MVNIVSCVASESDGNELAASRDAAIPTDSETAGTRKVENFVDLLASPRLGDTAFNTVPAATSKQCSCDEGLP